MALVKSVQIDIGVKGDAASKAKLDSISAKAEELKKAFPEYKLKIDSAAAAERVKVFKDELRSIPNETTAKVKVKVDSSALDKLSKSGFLKPSLLGSAVALSPALIPLAGGLAGAVGAIGASFGAAAIAAGGFGIVAKSVLASASSDSDKLLTIQTSRSVKMGQLQAQLAADTTKATRLATEKQIAALKKTTDAQTAIVKAGWTKSYSNVVDSLTKIKATWKDTSRSIASPVLLPWLDAVNAGMGFLKPLIQPVATEFQTWGQAIDRYFKSKAGSTEIHAMAVSFGQFASLQLANVVQFIRGVGSGIHSLGHDLSADGVYFGAFGDYLAKWGTEFAAWAKSKQARADVSGFLAYMHQNGATVVSILRDLAKVLPGILAGASQTGTLELQAISGFLGFIAGLPKGWQQPLTEAAGAMLLLSKTGVLSVGLKLAGTKAGAKVISALAGTAPLALPLVLTVAAVTGLNQIKDKKGGGTLVLPKAGDLGINGQWSKDINHWLNVGLDAIRHGVATTFDWVRHFVASDWDKTWGDAASRLVRGGHDVENKLDGLRHNIANTFDGIRHGIAAVWNTIWSNTVTRVRGGISTVVGWFAGLPRRAVGALFGLGHSLAAFASAAIGQMGSAFRNTFSSVIHWFQGLPSKILHALGVHSPPGWAVSAGKWIMKGLHIGLGHGLGQLTSFTTSIGAQVAGALSGALGGHMGDSGARTHSAAVAQAYARSLLSQYGWSANQMSSLIPLWNQESGWSAYAVNQSSGAYGIPQSLGHGHPYNLGDYKNQIVWGLNYIRGRYGSPAAAERHELAYNWYDKGGWLMPGLTLAMNKTGRPEQILPPGRSAATPVVLQVRAPHGATNLERALVEIIQKFVTVNGGDVQSALGRT